MSDGIERSNQFNDDIGLDIDSDVGDGVGDRTSWPGGLGRARSWTPEQVRALGVATSVAVAALVLGIGRTLAYHLAAAGRFPVPVIRAGTRLVVPVAPLLALLGIPPEPAEGEPRLDWAGPASVDRSTPADYDQPPVRGLAGVGGSG